MTSNERYEIAYFNLEMWSLRFLREGAEKRIFLLWKEEENDVQLHLLL
jgi:hypothetical protein